MDDTQAATSRRGSATGAELFMKAAALRSWPTIYFPCEGRQRVNSSEPSTSDKGDGVARRARPRGGMRTGLIRRLLFGQASIVDGDTLEIHGTRIRLWGIDAPESTQLCRGEDSLQYRCGAKAANDLDAFIGGRPVSRTPISLDQYGRTVATCSVNGTDLGQWLVGNGLALDWPNYSHGMYDKIQREAEHAGRGQAATSLRGCTGSASELVESQLIALMTRTRILDGCVGCWAA